MAEIFTVSTPKGGVGKTTLSYYLTQMFKEQGRTLFVDMDSQGNATKYLLGKGNKLPEENNVVQLFRKQPLKICKLEANLSLIGSNLLLSEFDAKSELNFYFLLSKFLKDQKNNFDYVIIDTPPNLGMFTLNALLATKYVLSPLDPSEDALDGLGVLLDTVQDIKEDHNSNIQLLGFILNGFDARNKADQRIEQSIQEQYKDLLFKSFIPRTTKIRDARIDYKSVLQVVPTHKVSSAYLNLFKEINQRISK